MERDIILEKVREADMVLVGLGEDFNGRKQLKDCPGYLSGCRSLGMLTGWPERWRSWQIF